MSTKTVQEATLLYAITDRAWLKPGETLEEQVETILANGATCLQIREKHLDDKAFLAEALRIKPICEAYDVPLIINDNVAIAKACDADGVHVGQNDMEIAAARAILGPDKWIGTSAHNVAEALKAKENGCDYMGSGAVFGSNTKTDAGTLDHQELRRICQATGLPVVAIGGITADNAARLAGTGVDGIAVISALFAQPDKAAATRQMLELARRVVNTPPGENVL